MSVPCCQRQTLLINNTDSNGHFPKMYSRVSLSKRIANNNYTALFVLLSELLLFDLDVSVVEA